MSTKAQFVSQNWLFPNSLRLVFLPTLLSCSSRFLRALQQNREQLRLLYLLNFIQTEIYAEKYSRSCLWLFERFLSRIELL